MEIDRRSLMLAASAGFAYAGLPFAVHASQNPDTTVALCGRKPDGKDYAFFGKIGGSLRSVALPERGHSPVFSPSGRRVAFPARRPGLFMLIADTTGAGPDQWFASPAGRHFCGHGVFINETTVITTENDYEAGRGVLGIWDLTTGKRIGEFDSHGVGPHDILPRQGGRTLVVANGGILTHPDTGRAKLNIPTMRPNLSIVDSETGELLDQVEPPAPLHKVSLRHIAVPKDDLVVVGGQYQGPESDNPSLIAVWRPGNALAFVPMDEQDTRALNHYCGSVMASPSAEYAVVTSPRGSVAHFISLGDEPELLDTIMLTDVCGAAAVADDTFVLTSGQGDFLSVQIRPDGTLRRRDLRPPLLAQWDNHARTFI
ncbi:MAG: DUF1513 domain-containing protein [Alphaproteobacteria bacterium]